MPDQPWRNSQPAPQLDEIRNGVAASSFVPQFVRWWWPALTWACLIFFLSTDTFSAAHTGSVLFTFFHWLRRSLTEDQFEPLHYLIRKTAHFTEYFVFCVLLFRGARGNRAGWRWTWGLAGLSIAAVYSALDEIHQAFVASRTSSPLDSLLDCGGAFVASVVLYGWYRRQGQTRQPNA